MPPSQAGWAPGMPPGGQALYDRLQRMCTGSQVPCVSCMRARVCCPATCLLSLLAGISPNCNLLPCLPLQVLVEYPTFLVLLPHEVGEYSLVQPPAQLAPSGSAGADATATASAAGGAPGASAAGAAAGASVACPPGSIHPAAAAAADAGGSPAAPCGPRPSSGSSGNASLDAAAPPAPMPAAAALQAAVGSPP